jgi:glycerol-3-phosphate dehydrogenase
MVRDLRRLADTRFDLVVVGAGFYGALAAWDATLRGLSVALVDKGDFGGGTSFNNLKTLHGGLRSLQSLNLRQMRLFIRERRALARVAPHLVRPMPFVVPTYRHYQRSALLMRAALLVNDLISRDRHDGLADPGLRLPAGELISRDQCLQFNPVIAPEGVTGGAVWHDYQMHNTDRMTLSFILSAAERGAAAANYVAARTLLRDGARVAGVTVEDQLSADSFDIRAPAVVNAAGPWATSWLHDVLPRATSPAPLLSRAMNIVTRPVVHTHACGGLANGRFLFLVPWRGVSLLGTSHDVHRDSPDRVTVTREDVEAFLAEGRAAFPQANLATADVHLVHRGLLPMISGHAGHVQLLRESAVVDHSGDGAAGLISMFGVRYTTARDTAERAVDAVFRSRGDSSIPACRTADTAVTGGAIEHKESFLRGALLGDTTTIPQEMLRRLALTYGTNYRTIVTLVRDAPDLAAPLGERCAVSAAEIVHAVRAEAAVKLSDAFIRRTEAGSAGHPGRDAIASAAAAMARELSWNDRRVADEIAETAAFYQLPV